MDEAEALARLRRILARPEFDWAGDLRPWERLIAAIGDAIYNLLVGAWDSVRSVATGQEGWIGLAMLALSLLVIGVVVFFVARAIGLSVAGDMNETARDAARRRQRSDELWRVAHELAAAGQLPEAIRSLYLSALYALEEHALLRVHEALTNREHVLRVGRDHPQVSGVLAAVVQRYDRFRYGNAPATRELFQELSGLVEQARASTA